MTTNNIIKKIGRSTYLINEQDRVYLLTCGKKKEVKSGKAREQALKIAKNLRAVHAAYTARRTEKTTD